MSHRIKKLKIELEKLHLDAFLISNFYNIYYLSGFKTLTKNEREAWLLITKNNHYLFTDGRYYEKIQNSKSKIKNYNSKLKITVKLISAEKNFFSCLTEIIHQEKISNLGFEAEDLRFNEYKKLQMKYREVQQCFSTIKLIPTEKLIIKLREIKEEEEIEKIKKACQITDQCLGEIIKTIKIDQTEKEIAFKIEYWLKTRGFDLAFYPIVAVDENSSLPHYDTKTNGLQKVKKGSMILIDFGVNYQDYLSDITRIVFVKKPTDEQLNIYRKLLNVQQKIIEQLKKTNNPKTIDQFGRSLIAHYQLSNYPHSTGHGIGLEIHEYPKISQTSTDAIEKNQVFTIEPGVYLPGKFGIRIEDTVWMKESSQAKILTLFPKKPMILS